MSRKEFENKIKRLTIMQKKEASNQHWDAIYNAELKKRKQIENEKKYAIIIKYVTEEVAKRQPGIISKRETALIIDSILARSKYISERFNRTRARYL